MPSLVVTLLLAHGALGADTAPTWDAVTADEPTPALSGLFEGGDNPLANTAERQRCLSAAGVGLAGALVGAALLGGGVWVVGMATYQDEDGKLVGAPDPTTQRFFVPGFAAAGAFLGGALASVGTYLLVEPDDRPSVLR